MPNCDSYSESVGAPTAEEVVRAPGRKPLPAIPQDFPHPARLGDWGLIQALVGRHIPRSTRTDWQRNGVVPPVEKVIGRRSYWREVTLAKAFAVDDPAVHA